MDKPITSWQIRFLAKHVILFPRNSFKWAVYLVNLILLSEHANCPTVAQVVQPVQPVQQAPYLLKAIIPEPEFRYTILHEEDQEL